MDAESEEFAGKRKFFVKDFASLSTRGPWLLKAPWSAAARRRLGMIMTMLITNFKAASSRRTHYEGVPLLG